MEDPLPSYPGYALRRAANAAAAELANRLSTIGLRQSDASALILIGLNPHITASTLGKQLDIQRANMVPLLKRLEEDHLIERKPIDGKSQGLTLTNLGKIARDEAGAVIEDFEGDLLAQVPAQHRDHFLPALNALWR